MLLADVQTLCDADYVNNPEIVSPDSGVLLGVYPGASSHFSVYDGTEVDCQSDASRTAWCWLRTRAPSSFRC